MTCWHHVPGQVLCLRKLTGDCLHDKGSTRGLHESLESVIYRSAHGSFRLDLFMTGPGEELRLVSQLQREIGVLGASLNYLGKNQQSVINTATDMWGLREAMHLVFDSGDETPRLESDEGNAEETKRRVVAVVDPAEVHCKNVMHSVLAGHNWAGGEDLRVLGRCLLEETLTLIDLYHYSKLLMSLIEVEQEIYAINMSVDFGVICLRNEDPLPSAIALMSFSFPFFETVISVVTEMLRKNSLLQRTKSNEGETYATIPAWFSAAGNRSVSGDTPRQRLGYPAIRPETIAVTYADVYSKGFVSPDDSAEIPLVYDLKPCVAVSPKKCGEKCNPDGTSFACAWLAGVYAARSMREDDELVQTSKERHNHETKPLRALGPMSRLARILDEWTDRRSY